MNPFESSLAKYQVQGILSAAIARNNYSDVLSLALSSRKWAPLKVNRQSAHAVFENRAVEFSINADGQPVICWISWETLADHFGATRETAVETLLANYDKVAPIAEKVYRARSPDERLVVTTEDF